MATGAIQVGCRSNLITAVTVVSFQKHDYMLIFSVFSQLISVFSFQEHDYMLIFSLFSQLIS